MEPQHHNRAVAGGILKMKSAFLQQRLYPTLLLGRRPTVTHGKYSVSVHARQSDLDSACGLHNIAMVFTLLGLISHPQALPKRIRGVAARLWRAAQETYFTGLSEIDLAEMIEALNSNLHVNYVAGSHRKTREFTTMAMENGALVILSYRTKDGRANVGCD